MRAEGYFKLPLANGQSPQELAAEIMESGDFDGPDFIWLNRMLNEGVVSVHAIPASSEGAERFTTMVARLKAPINPSDYVEWKRPQRKD